MIMKKLLFIIAIAVSGLGYSQIPESAQITEAQLENSRLVKEKNDKFNAAINQKVDKIMSITNLNIDDRDTLSELIVNKETQTANIARLNISDSMKESKINDVKNEFETQLKAFLGETKYNLVKNTLSTK